MKKPISIALGVAMVLGMTLAPVAASEDIRDIAVAALVEAGFDPADIDDVIVTDSYTSEHNAVTHVYLRQTVDGEPVAGANATLALQGGELIHSASKFVLGLDDAASGSVALSMDQAVSLAADDRGMSTDTLASTPVTRHRAIDEQTVRRVYEVELQSENDWWVVDVDAETGEILHVVNLVDREDLALIAAATARQESADTVGVGFDNAGATLVPSDGHGHSHGVADVDQQSEGNGNTPVLPPEQALDGSSYNVYPMPVEHPLDGERRIVDNPASALASPFGWHDTDGVAGAEHTDTRGNNVHAYTDTAAAVDESPLNAQGGDSLDFDDPIVSLDATPASYREAAITNLFYWNNVMHDVTYHYGFDEAAGNFQQTNYTGQGTGGDAVNAEAQDGGGALNANFATPADGSPGRMQMYLWVDAFRDLALNVNESARTSRSTQVRDGDLDSGVIAHEYGHGISNRLVGGPNTVGCLGSHDEREGEGWSDFWSYSLTAREGETGTDQRGLGNYVVYYDDRGPRSGPGIRITPYTTDMSINPSTYNTIIGAAEPHGVGYVWASMLFDLHWNLVDAHGFNQNVYEDWTTGGNNRAIQIVTDGMKFAPCEPSFVEARDAIIAAADALTGDPADGVRGEDHCLIWETFARRGLGVDADAGDFRSKTDQTESYDIPAYCE